MKKWFSRDKRLTYLLDTNVLIDFFQHSKVIAEKLSDVGCDSCAISVLTLYELVRGAYNAKTEEQLQHEMQKIEIIKKAFLILPLPEDAKSYGEEWKRLRSEGTPLDDFDLIIGTTALEHGLIMVTNNIKHMSRIQGLAIENWK